MHRTIVGCLLLATAVVGAAGPTVVEFSSPAQASGAGSWADLERLLLIVDKPRTTFDVAFAGDATATVYHERYLEYDLTQTEGNPPLTGDSPREMDLGARWRARLTLLRGPGAIYVEGTGLHVAVHGSQSFDATLEGFCFTSALTPSESMERLVRSEAVPCEARSGVLVRSGPSDTAIAFHLSGATVSVVEWHGFQASCAGPCPDPAARERTSHSLAGREVSVSDYRFVRVEGTGGSLRGPPAEARVALGWGHAVSLVNQSWLRLPDATGSVHCPRCSLDGEATLRVTGDVDLVDLHPTSEGRLTAMMQGSAVLVSDEGTAFPWSSDKVGVGAVAAVAVSLLLWKVAALLAARVPADRVLQHQRRALVYEAIRSNAGAGRSKLATITGVPASTLRFHLLVLARTGLVVAKTNGRVRRYFENHGRYDASWRARTALEDWNLRTLYEWMLQQGPRSQADIVDSFKAQGWARSTTEHRLRRLADSALVLKSGRTYQGLQMPAARPVPAANGTSAPALGEAPPYALR